MSAWVSVDPTATYCLDCLHLGHNPGECYDREIVDTYTTSQPSKTVRCHCGDSGPVDVWLLPGLETNKETK